MGQLDSTKQDTMRFILSASYLGAVCCEPSVTQLQFHKDY
jgi:hypothetical protein